MTAQLPGDHTPSGNGGIEDPGARWSPRRERIAVWSGAVLALSYPVLALSAGVRAAYQIFLKGGGGPIAGPITSAVAAVLYLAATVGFAVRRRWAWALSVAVLSLELALAVVVGTVSVAAPERIGSSVWRLYGIDYAFFPLIQPLLGLLWLFWPLTMFRYGVRKPVELDSSGPS